MDLTSDARHQQATPTALVCLPETGSGCLSVSQVVKLDNAGVGYFSRDISKQKRNKSKETALGVGSFTLKL